MSEYTVSVRLKADGSGLVGETRAANKELDALTQTAKRYTDAQTAQARIVAQREQAGRKFLDSLRDEIRQLTLGEAGLMRYKAAQAGVLGSAGPLIAQIEALKKAQAAQANESDRSSRSLSQLRSILPGVFGVASLAGAVAFTRTLVEAGLAAQRVRQGLAFATGSPAAGEQSYQRLRATVYELGLVLDSSSRSFMKLEASSQGTTLQGAQTERVFRAVAGAATVLGLSAGETDGVLLAISQMMSKGTVQAEELRGQLGERLPGAFQIAARAMGVTTAELGKMLEAGGVASAEFLPKFAAELERTFAQALPSATRSAQAEINRFESSWTEMKQTLAESGVLSTVAEKMSAIAQSMREVTAAAREAKNEGAWEQFKVWAGGAMSQIPGAAMSFAPRGRQPGDVYVNGRWVSSAERAAQAANALSLGQSTRTPGAPGGSDEMTSGLAAYAAAITALDKATAEYLPKSEKMRREIAQIKRLYSGLVPEAELQRAIALVRTHYSETKAATDLDATYRGLKKILAEKLLVDGQQTEVQKLMLSLDALSAKQLDTLSQARQTELFRLAQKIDSQREATAATEADAKAEQAWLAVQEDADRVVRAIEDKRTRAILDTEKQIEQIQFETGLIGANNLARETAIALRAMESQGIKQGSADYEELARRMREALAGRDARQASEDQRRQTIDDYRELFRTVEQTGKSAFAHLMSEGTSTSEAIGKSIQTAVIDLLHQLTARKWMIQIGTGLEASLYGTQGMGASSLSVLSGGGSLVNAGSSLGAMFGGSATTGAGYMASAGEAYTYGIGAAEYGAGGLAAASGTGAMSTLAAAAPYVAAAIFVANELGLFDGGAPKNSTLGINTSGIGGPAGTLAVTQDNMGANLTTPQIIEINAWLAQLPDRLKTSVDGMMLELAPGADAAQAWAQLQQQIGATAQGLDLTTEELRQLGTLAEQTAYAEQLASARRAIEIQIMTAQGDEIGALAAQREMEIAALEKTYPALVELQKSLYGAQDAAVKRAEEERKAADIERERQGLQEQLTNLSLTSVERLALQRAALDESNRALFDQVQAAQAAAEATDAAADALQTWTAVQQDRAAAMDSARGALRTAYQAEVTLQDERVAAVASAQSALRQAYQSQASALEATAKKWQDAAAALRAYRDGLAITTGTPAAGYAEASRQFGAVSARAQLGDEAAIGELQSASEALRTTSETASATRLDYLRDVGRIQAAVANTAGVADRRASIEQDSLATLRSQVSALIDIEAGVTSVDQAIATLQTAGEAAAAGARELDKMTEQVSGLIAINDSVMTVEQAIRDLEGAITGLALGAGSGTLRGAPRTEQWLDSATGSTWVSGAGAVATRGAGQGYGDAMIHGIDGSTFTVGAAQAAIQDYAARGDLMGIYMGAKRTGVSLASVAALAGVSAQGVEDWARAQGLPTFASGGLALGGAMVGERGAEFADFKTPARIYSAEQTRGMFHPAANDGLLTEVKKLREEVTSLRGDLAAANIAIAQYTQKTAKLLDQWDGDGMPDVRAA